MGIVLVDVPYINIDVDASDAIKEYDGYRLEGDRIRVRKTGFMWSLVKSIMQFWAGGVCQKRSTPDPTSTAKFSRKMLQLW